MPTVKILNEPYDNEDAMENLINYICRSGHIGGTGLDPEYALMGMSLVKRLWHKTHGRQVRHFILSFADHEDLTYDELMSVGYAVASYYADRFQIVFGLHFDTGHTHIHFCMNTVGFTDGVMYSGSFADFSAFQAHIQRILPRWKVELVVEHSNYKFRN